MNFKYIQKKLHEKHNQRTLCSAHFVGETLKRKRQSMKLSQQVVSSGICSVSYLSKVENNKMYPSDFFIEEVSKKVGLELDHLLRNDEETSPLFPLIKAFYYRRHDNLRKLCEEAEAVKHPMTRDVHQLFFHVADNDTVRSEEIIERLQPLFGSMDYLTGVAFIILSAIHARESGSLNRALNLLMIVEPYDKPSPYLEVLEQLNQFIVKQQLRLKNFAADHYSKALNGINRYHEPDKLLTLQLYRAFYLADESPSMTREILRRLEVTVMPKRLLSMYRYVEIDSKLKMDIPVTQQDFNNLKACECNEWYYRALSLIPAEVLDEDSEEALGRIFSSAPDMNLLDKVHYRVQRATGESREDLLRNIALPLAIEKESLDHIDAYTDELMTKADDNARYKDAFCLMKKREKAIEKILTSEL